MDADSAWECCEKLFQCWKVYSESHLKGTFDEGLLEFVRERLGAYWQLTRQLACFQLVWYVDALFQVEQKPVVVLEDIEGVNERNWP